MLFSTIDEFAVYVPVNTSLSFDTIKRDILRVERKYLLPYLGQAQYNALDAAYDNGNGSLTGAQQLLMDYVRDVVALFTTAQALPIIQVQISDSGVKSHDTDTEKTAAQWKVDQLTEDYCIKLGWDAIDEMLKFLEANTYPLWEGDTTASTINKQFVINTTAEFNKYYFINESPSTFKALEPSMRNVQTLDFEGGPGPDLLARILSEIASGTITADIAKILIWVKPMFANMVIARGLKELFVTVRADGVYHNGYKATSGNENNRERTAAAAAQAQRINECLTQADIYRKKLVDYLNANATSSKYPEWFNSSLYVAPEAATETYPCTCGECDECCKKTTQSRKIFRIGYYD